jgi:hypothetical protein
MVQIILVYDPARQPFQSQVRSKPSEAILTAITGQTEPGFVIRYEQILHRNSALLL